MQQKTTLFSVMVVVLTISGLFAWWLLSTLGTRGPSAQTSQTSVGYSSNQTVVTNAPGQTQTQTTAATDLAAAYSNLFQQLLAQPVAFTSVRAASSEMGSVYSLYSKDLADAKASFPAASNLAIDIALVDLNEDGTPEALVFENLPGYCGTAGCPLDIYKKQQGKWVAIFTTLTGRDIGISNTYTNDYADLFMAKENFVVRYAWDGKQYIPREVVARWNGSVFEQTQ